MFRDELITKNMKLYFCSFSLIHINECFLVSVSDNIPTLDSFHIYSIKAVSYIMSCPLKHQRLHINGCVELF